MDLIVRNARLSHMPDAPPMDIGIATGRIAAIEPALQADGTEFDAAASAQKSGTGGQVLWPRQGTWRFAGPAAAFGGRTSQSKSAAAESRSGNASR